MPIVLAKVPYGSRLYGTFDEKSDWDWKQIVIPSKLDLLMGKPVKNVFYCSSSDKIKNTSDDTDVEFVPIHTLCKDFFAGQTYAIEVVFGILQQDKIPGIIVYDPLMVQIAQELVDNFLTANIQAMVGYAFHQSQLYSDKGDRLAKLHEFRDYVQYLLAQNVTTVEDKLVVAMNHPNDMIERFATMLDGQMMYKETTLDHNQIPQLNYNLLGKRYPENITIAEALTRVNLTIGKYGARANAAMEAKGKDWKAISHAVRITQEALSVLNNKYVTLPLDPESVDFLKKIKYGEVDWAVVQTLLVDNIDQIAIDQRTSTLPVADEELKKEFDRWFKRTICTLYMEPHPNELSN